MTMSRQVDTKREIKNRRRALASVKAAADRTARAIHDQVTVLTDLRVQSSEIEQLDHVTAIQTLADIQLKASNEVKKLHSLINQLAQLRGHLASEDSQDKQVAQILSLLNSLEVTAQDEINLYIEELEEVRRKTASPLFTSTVNEGDSSSNGLLFHLSSFLSRSSKSSPVSTDDASSDFCDLSTDAKVVMGEKTANVQLTEEIEQRRKLARAWKSLQRDVQDLNDTFKRVAAAVWIQGDRVNRIEENITNATCNVNEGAVTLSKIKKNAALPLIGAAVGGAIAGPIGLMAGYKLAALAALGTASLGYISGKAVQKVTNPPAIEPPPPVMTSPTTSTTTTSSNLNDFSDSSCNPVSSGTSANDHEEGKKSKRAKQK